jgi:hypothetical protein
MKRALLCVALALVVAGAANAQEQQTQPAQQQVVPPPPPPGELRRTFAMAGTVELVGALSFASYTPVVNGSTGSSSQTLALSPSVGYFVIDQVELVLNPLIVSFAWSGDVSTLTLMPLAGVAYNFRANPRAFPYLEGVAGFAYSRWSNGGMSSSERGLVWAGRAGVKALLTGTAIVNIALQYQQVTLNRSGDSERNGYNQIGFTAGLSVWL